MEIIVYDLISNMLWAIINTYTYSVLVFIFNRNKRKSMGGNSLVFFVLLCFVIELAQRFILAVFPTPLFLFSALDPIFLLLRVLLIVIFFNTRLWKSFALVLFYYVGYYLSYLLMVNLLSLRTMFTFEEGFTFHTRMMHEMSLLAVVILFFYSIVLLLGIRRRRKSAPKVSPFHVIGVLLPSCLYIIGYFIIFPYMLDIANKDFPFIIGTIMFTINVAAFLLIFDADRKNTHLYYLDKQYKIQEQYFARIKEDSFSVQKFAHDERKHYVHITGLLKQGEYERLGEYLASLGERAVDFESLFITGNIDIDTVLNAKIAEAEEAGCRIAVEGRLPASLTIDPVDFCILIGNCIDNAIIACLKTNDRTIKVNFTYYKNLLFIWVQNAYVPSHKIVPVNGELEEYFEPAGGMGLPIMTSVARKYNGHLEIVRKDNIFATEIILHAGLGPDSGTKAPEQNGLGKMRRKAPLG